ncbi:MAG TPA: mechanosensitive ion channel domain-containing protein [Lachnospiraceae bacterium]|nr:mechanosensitive ion channel domain-containing protein [Lachnospiraceae bacterium]HEX3075573.1 mechanosensitive ion channel domain-containing protein [Lachnospiraceae bacterium]
MSYSSIFLLTEAADKAKKSAEYLDEILDKVLDFVWLLIPAIIIFIVGRKVIKLLNHIFERTLKKSNMEASVATFFMALVRALLNALLVMIIIDKVGLNISSLVAVLGTATLSIGLALQGSLSNFAGGVLILLMKPFRVGDYIITATNEGTVTSLDIIYTRLLTADNRLVVIPNGALSNSSIINVTHEPIRRLDISVLIDYSENIKKVKDILESLAKSHELVLQDREINVFVNSFDPSAINIGIRMWVERDNYWILKWDMLEKIRDEFENNQVTTPFDQVNVNIASKE